MRVQLFIIYIACFTISSYGASSDSDDFSEPSSPHALYATSSPLTKTSFSKELQKRLNLDLQDILRFSTPPPSPSIQRSPDSPESELVIIKIQPNKNVKENIYASPLSHQVNLSDCTLESDSEDDDELRRIHEKKQHSKTNIEDNTYASPLSHQINLSDFTLQETTEQKSNSPKKSPLQKSPSYKKVTSLLKKATHQNLLQNQPIGEQLVPTDSEEIIKRTTSCDTEASPPQACTHKRCSSLDCIASQIRAAKNLSLSQATSNVPPSSLTPSKEKKKINRTASPLTKITESYSEHKERRSKEKEHKKRRAQQKKEDLLEKEIARGLYYALASRVIFDHEKRDALYSQAVEIYTELSGEEENKSSNPKMTQLSTLVSTIKIEQNTHPNAVTDLLEDDKKTVHQSIREGIDVIFSMYGIAEEKSSDFFNTAEEILCKYGAQIIGEINIHKSPTKDDLVLLKSLLSSIDNLRKHRADEGIADKCAYVKGCTHKLTTAIECIENELFHRTKYMIYAGDIMPDQSKNFYQAAQALYTQLPGQEYTTKHIYSMLAHRGLFLDIVPEVFIISSVKIEDGVETISLLCNPTLQQDRDFFSISKKMLCFYLAIISEAKIVQPNKDSWLQEITKALETIYPQKKEEFYNKKENINIEDHIVSITELMQESPVLLQKIKHIIIDAHTQKRDFTNAFESILQYFNQYCDIAQNASNLHNAIEKAVKTLCNSIRLFCVEDCIDTELYIQELENAVQSIK